MNDQILHHKPTALPRIHLGAPTIVGPLTLFPIWTDAPVPGAPTPVKPPRSASISEHPDGPKVDTLVGTNPGAKPFAFLEGTIVDGGWQHRVLVHSVLVGAGATLELPVRCIEQGRWRGDGDQRVHGRQAPLGVRGAVRGLSRTRPHPHRSADQGEVWSRVAAYEQTYGASDTSSLVEVLGNVEVPEDVRAATPAPLLGQRGLLVGVGGHPALLELFEHPRSLERQWSSVIDGLLRAAMHVPPVTTTTRRARAFIARLDRRATENAAPAGTGFLSESEDDLVSVRSLHAPDGALIHSAALNIRHDLVLAA